jgi:uncharacterized protein (DUF433 family)
MGVTARAGDPLLGGFYTVSEAARLLQIENRQRISSWLQGRTNGSFQPMLARDYSPVKNVQELSFWDLMEVRFIHHFRKQGLSLQFLRKVAARARREFGSSHPFALSKVKFMTDRKKIFQHTLEEEGDAKTRDIMGDQFEMYEIIENVLAKGVTFDPRSHLAEKWRPLEGDCPNVIVDPRFAFGHPVISDRRIPTSAISKTWRAERANTARVAEWFNISKSEVKEAVEFETRLAG